MAFDKYPRSTNHLVALSKCPVLRKKCVACCSLPMHPINKATVLRDAATGLLLDSRGDRHRRRQGPERLSHSSGRGLVHHADEVHQAMGGRLFPGRWWSGNKQRRGQHCWAGIHSLHVGICSIPFFYECFLRLEFRVLRYQNL